MMWLIPTLLFLSAAIALLLVLRKASRPANLPVTAEWIDELSTERYRPMMHLLDGSDLEFLRLQPGFTPKMAHKLRAQRYQIFRGYLRCLQEDFERVCAAIKILMLQSRDDRPDLARVLLHQQLLFSAGMLVVEARLILYRCGICSVDVTNLVKIFDGMRIELRSLVPVSDSLGA
jgi:hypothetical protein